MVNITVCYAFISVFLDETLNVTWLPADLTQHHLLVKTLIDAVFLKETAGRLVWFWPQSRAQPRLQQFALPFGLCLLLNVYFLGYLPNLSSSAVSSSFGHPHIIRLNF